MPRTPRHALRHGFTTGTAAAAAAKAAALLLLTGRADRFVEVPLPRDGRLTVPVAEARTEGPGRAFARVVKDAGDDPDATHKASITARVALSAEPVVTVSGGKGVGRVTRPGLPVAVGRAAINPAPRAQIAAAAAEALAEGAPGRAQGLAVLVEVPEGEKIALKTMNARLGIIGGISILGTRGTVKPFSHAAWQATIDTALDMASAAGRNEVWFTTGGRSERFLRAARPSLPEDAVVQAADHFAHACAQAARRGFSSLGWSVFFGKLVKQAMNLPDTHARHTAIDFDLLARWCVQHGLRPDAARAVSRANTALEALTILREAGSAGAVAEGLAGRAARNAAGFAQGALRASCLVFDFDGSLIAAHTTEETT